MHAGWRRTAGRVLGFVPELEYRIALICAGKQQLATVTYDAIGSGATDFFLQIGRAGITRPGQRSSEVEVVFGGDDDPALNAEHDRETRSATADGSVSLQYGEDAQ